MQKPTRKVYTKGHSVAVTIPNQIAGMLGIKDGDVLEFDMPYGGRTFTVSKASSTKPKKVTTDEREEGNGSL